MAIDISIATFIVVCASAFAIFIYLKYKKLAIDSSKREEDTKRKMYELAILKELDDRMGYSLNVQNIIDVITGSLRQFIDYSAVSYMLVDPEKIIFKVHLEKSISQKFIDEIKKRMLGSISALLDYDYSNQRIEEVITGAILSEEIDKKVESFFNIPLVIAGKVVGVLTIADTKSGLYKEEEMTILYKITNQASRAVSRLQEVVESEEAKLNSMVSSMSEGVVMVDKDFRVLVTNPAIRKIFQFDNIKELSVFDFIDKLAGKFDFRQQVNKSLQESKILISQEVQINERFFQIAVSPVKNILLGNKENTLGSVVIFHDITPQKEAEKMRENFTSMIVHELRSPLDAIKKTIDLTRSSNANKKKRETYLQLMRDSSSDMLDLVNNLLDMAKIEAGKFDIIKKNSDLRLVIKDSINFYGVSAEYAKLKLKSDIANDVPSEINFDAHAIFRVISNLISNAIKFSKEGGLF